YRDSRTDETIVGLHYHTDNQPGTCLRDTDGLANIWRQRSHDPGILYGCRDHIIVGVRVFFVENPKCEMM
ncbi:MAG: hypothetical protein KKD31_18880, partial [Bacteroidetes bacterium]|nr:hypothetical protein [Bacteroidota bacterium]